MRTLQPPHNQEAEQGLLGTLMFDNNAFDKMGVAIKPEHFYVAVNGEIYAKIEEHILTGKQANPVTLKNYFEDHPALKSIGGASYLTDISDMVLGTSNTSDYAQQIYNLWQRRCLMQAANELIDVSIDFEQDNIFESTEKVISSITDRAASNEKTVAEAVEEAEKWINEMAAGLITSYKTGYKGIDDIIGGLYGSRLYFIAARPGMGKTALALNMAENLSHTITPLFDSLEMSAQELSMRLIAGHSNLTISRQQSPHNLSMVEIEELRAAKKVIQKLNLMINDTGGMSLPQILTSIRRHVRKHGKSPVFIDYLGLIQTDKRIKNKVHQIEEITNSLKAIAKELDIPVVVLSQLSRAVEQREDKRPMLSDLRDSGSIEQDADVVMFVYREEYYSERQEPLRNAGEPMEYYNDRIARWKADNQSFTGETEVIVAKNRQGRGGTAKLRFNGDKQRFS